MKGMKALGCVGIVGAALAFSSNSLTLAETSLKTSIIGTEKAGNVVHMVNSALASDQRYSSSVPVGYKWRQSTSDMGVSTDPLRPLAGYKWGRSSTAEQAGSKWGRS